MRLINLLIIFIVALIFEARGEPTTENNVTVENESCNENTIEEPESLVKENPEPSDSKTTLPESEPQEGSEDLVDKEKSQNINASTEVPGTERTLTEPEPQEGSEKLDEKEKSLDNSSTDVAATENTTNSEPNERPDNLDDEEQSLKNNSSTETPSTECTLTDSEAQKGTDDVDDKDQSLNNNSFIEVPDTEGSLLVSYYNEARGRNAIGPFSKIQLHKLPIPTKSPRRAHHLRRTMIKIFEGLEKGLKKILDPESDEESVETS
ncbi:clumping factor B [Helicoverpa armigera]|uniref:clumping factor B n=1 Tax=Helicoverpa armigera TaxID=29058 RepID=UPI0030836B28